MVARVKSGVTVARVGIRENSQCKLGCFREYPRVYSVKT